MFGSEILDVVIGMIFVFLLLSLVCSAINEIIEAWLNKRAKNLEQGIRELLNDEDGTELVKKIYDHPLVSGLFRGEYDSAKVNGFLNLGSSQLPSYIPSRNFALALMDVVSPAIAAKPFASPATDNAPATPDIPATDAVASGAVGATTPSTITSPLAPLREAVGNLKNPKVEQALMTLLDAAGDDATRARENIEAWFNSSMDRVSGWYKRRTQVIILVLGLLVAVGLNADSITISNALSHDKALRDTLVTSAQEYAKKDGALPSASPVPSPASKEKKAECEKNKSQSAECKEVCLDDVNSPECKLETNLAKIRGLGLPIGWDRNNPKLVPPKEDIGGWLLKIFGWLITAVAISLGAPFWFDLLNKFMVVRSTVKPREKSHEEGSKE